MARTVAKPDGDGAQGKACGRLGEERRKKGTGRFADDLNSKAHLHCAVQKPSASAASTPTSAAARLPHRERRV
jgi:hypothetical protein